MSWETLSGSAWRGFRLPDFPHESWQIDAGTLHARGNADPIDLISRKSFRSFALSLEWRLSYEGNSGVLYRVTEDQTEAWQSGPEMQLIDDAHHPDRNQAETSCGALYGLLGPEQGHFPAALSFRTAQLFVRGDHVEHWLNELPMLAYNLSDPVLEEKISQSKFRDYPRFAKQQEGHIVLQHHSTDAWFRNIRIHELPD